MAKAKMPMLFYKVIIVTFLALAGLSVGACGTPSAPSGGGGIVAFQSPSGNLNVSPTTGPVGTRPVITWQTTASSGLIQICEVRGTDCLGLRQVATGSSGQVTDQPLSSGKWQYRLVGSNTEGISFVLDTRGVSIN